MPGFGAPIKQPDGALCETRPTPLLCDGQVRCVGDAVAFIVADSVKQAQDAAELIGLVVAEQKEWQSTMLVLEHDASPGGAAESVGVVINRPLAARGASVVFESDFGLKLNTLTQVYCGSALAKRTSQSPF